MDDQMQNGYQQPYNPNGYQTPANGANGYQQPYNPNGYQAPADGANGYQQPYNPNGYQPYYGNTGNMQYAAPKKKNGKMIAGIVLLAFQLLAILGNLASKGSPIPVPDGGNVISNAAFLFGYFLFGIVGIVLLVLSLSKKK